MDITADQLRQLSSLTALDLAYNGRPEPASAGAWPLLPLQRLSLACINQSAPVCQRLAQLSGLTSLVLQSFMLHPRQGLAQQLAAALRQLSGLQQLELTNPWWPLATSAEEKAAGARQLLQATGSLQQLRELRLRRFCMVAVNSSSLAALTALTLLELSNCDLTDAAATAIVLKPPGLQSLDCSGSYDIEDAMLPAIGQLQKLTRLSLSDTSVSHAGLSPLTGLTRLRELHLPYRVTAQQKSWLLQHLPVVAVVIL